MNAAVHLHEFMTDKGVAEPEKKIAVVTGGIALGIDRLLMLFADQPTLDELSFAFSTWLHDNYHHHHHRGIDERVHDVDIVDHQVEHDIDIGCARVERRQPVRLDECWCFQCFAKIDQRGIKAFKVAHLDQQLALRDQAKARLAELVRGPRQEVIAEARARLEASEVQELKQLRDYAQIDSPLTMANLPGWARRSFRFACDVSSAACVRSSRSGDASPRACTSRWAYSVPWMIAPAHIGQGSIVA